jgi:hypothetical protein
LGEVGKSGSDACELREVAVVKALLEQLLEHRMSSRLGGGGAASGVAQCRRGRRGRKGDETAQEALGADERDAPVSCGGFAKYGFRPRGDALDEET